MGGHPNPLSRTEHMSFMGPVLGVGTINDANLHFQHLLQLSIQNIWASIQNVWCAQHSAQLSYILYGDFSHTFCMGIASTLGARKGRFQLR